MRIPLKILLGYCVCVLSIGPFKARATLEVGVSVQIHAKADFNTPLATYGHWIDVPSYGHCWRPAGIAVGWRPYCFGDWVWTDCGWYWYSDEPWAWACYHYGYWVYDDDYGWIWLPGVEWAPARVSWRVGDGYIGWAPLPPPGVIFAHVAAFSEFVFVKVGHFTEPVRPDVIIRNKPAIIKETKLISKAERQTREINGAKRKVMINEGPGLDAVEKATGRKINSTPIREAARRTWVPPLMKQKSAEPEELGKDLSGPGSVEKHSNLPEQKQGKPAQEQSPQGAPSNGKSSGEEIMPRAHQPYQEAVPSSNHSKSSGWKGEGHDKSKH